MIKKTYFMFFVVLVSACYYDVEETLYPRSSECNTSEVSYTKDILPIMNNNGCISCHGALSSISLHTYDALKVYANNGRLYGSMAHESGFRPMPEAQPKLDACALDKIKAWIAQGALNN